MSATILSNPVTHNFPVSTFPILLTFHHPFVKKDHSFSFKNPYFLPRSYLSRKYISGFSPKLRNTRFMAERVVNISALGSNSNSNDDDDNINFSALEQEAFIDGSSQIRSNFLSPHLEASLNLLSKWLVAAVFGAVILWRHDPEAMWAAMGSVLNSALSVVLKKVLNQPRPIANLRSDPGMPSSHAQSIFYAVIFLVLSMAEWQGINELTLIFSIFFLAVGTYLSWLRVSQGLHSISQVVVGAVLGTCFSLLWIWSWDALVLDAFNSSLGIRLSVLLSSAICCLGFLVYVVLNWFSNER